MEEPKKILRCHFLGTIEVAAPTGVDVLNGAMMKVYARVPPEKWLYVDMAVAPSTITISEHGVRGLSLQICNCLTVLLMFHDCFLCRTPTT